MLLFQERGPGGGKTEVPGKKVPQGNANLQQTHVPDREAPIKKDRGTRKFEKNPKRCQDPVLLAFLGERPNSKQTALSPERFRTYFFRLSTRKSTAKATAVALLRLKTLRVLRGSETAL